MHFSIYLPKKCHPLFCGDLLSISLHKSYIDYWCCHSKLYKISCINMSLLFILNNASFLPSLRSQIFRPDILFPLHYSVWTLATTKMSFSVHTWCCLCPVSLSVRGFITKTRALYFQTDDENHLDKWFSRVQLILIILVNKLNICYILWAKYKKHLPLSEMTSAHCSALSVFSLNLFKTTSVAVLITLTFIF